MATYIGYYRADPESQRELGAQARETGEHVVSDKMREKVIGLRDNLPSSIKLVGSWTSLSRSPEQPNVWIAETDDPLELSFINNWYQGFLIFDWVPARALGNTSQQTGEAMQAAR